MLTLETYIKEVRRSQRLTQREAANISGIMRATIQNWECGRTFPRTSEVAQYFERMGLPDARDQALLLVRTPDAREKLAISPRDHVEADGVLPPVSGVLLRAMRNRRGQSLEQVSAETGLSYSYLSRVENGERSLPGEKLADYLGYLNALPEEREAFASGRFQQGVGQRAAETDDDLEALEWERHYLHYAYVTQGRLYPAELHLLCLQERLWPLARRGNLRALALLAKTYQDLAEWNFQRGQGELAGGWVRQGLQLFNPGWEGREAGTLTGLLLQGALCLAGSGRHFKPRRGLRSLLKAEERIQPYGRRLRNQVLRAMATYSAQDGQLGAATEYYEDARRCTGDEVEDQIGLRWARMRICIEAGRADEALAEADWNEQNYPSRGTARVRYNLFVAQALFVGGRKQEAWNRFLVNEQYCQENGYRHIIAERREFARRTGVPESEIGAVVQ